MNGYEKTLWGPSRDASSITPSDMNQGYIGNCWVIAAVSALAEVPGRIDRIIENEVISQDGIYALNMYLLGVPFTMIVDDKMPMNQHGNTFFGGLGKDGSVWGAVIEKAFAKYYGAYEHMIGGFMEKAVTALNGSPHIDQNGETPEEMWEMFVAHDEANDIITAASKNCGNHFE